MLKSYLKRSIAVAMLASIATFAYAEDSAPVYDADNYPPQFDNQPDLDAPTPRVQPQPQLQSGSSYDSPRSLSTDQRINKIEQQIDNMQRGDASTKIDALQTELRTLRGQVEELTHQLQQMQAQQRSMYSDIDKRLNKQVETKAKVVDQEPEQPDVAQPKTTPDDVIVPKKAAPASKAADAPKVAAADTTSQPNTAEEQQIYQNAYNLIKAKKYNEAVATLQKMLQKYPTGQSAANAHYWLGELYGLMGKNDQSAVEFNTIVRDFPESPKVADAQLKLGLIYAAAFKWPDAKMAFRKVVNHYPGTASARLAAEQLKQIKSAGH